MDRLLWISAAYRKGIGSGRACLPLRLQSDSPGHQYNIKRDRVPRVTKHYTPSPSAVHGSRVLGNELIAVDFGAGTLPITGALMEGTSKNVLAYRRKHFRCFSRHCYCWDPLNLEIKERPQKSYFTSFESVAKTRLTFDNGCCGNCSSYASSSDIN